MLLEPALKNLLHLRQMSRAFANAAAMHSRRKNAVAYAPRLIL